MAKKINNKTSKKISAQKNNKASKKITIKTS